VQRFLLKAKLCSPEPFLQLLDFRSSEPNAWDPGYEESLASLLSLAPATDVVPNSRWGRLPKSAAAQFGNTLARLINSWFEASHDLDKWKRRASRMGWSDDKAKLEAMLHEMIYLMGEDAGCRKLPVVGSKLLAEVGLFKLDASETILGLPGTSLADAARTAAYLIFWQIARRGLTLRCCAYEDCRSIFIVGRRTRFCGRKNCGSKFSSDLLRKNLAHWQNNQRIGVMIGVLIQWTRRPSGSWSEAVLRVWHQYERGRNKKGGETKKDPQRDQNQHGPLCQHQ
jgi:hypothetical protein